LILPAPFYLADQAAAVGLGGSDHYEGNNDYQRYNEGYYPSLGLFALNAIGVVDWSAPRRRQIASPSDMVAWLIGNAETTGCRRATEVRKSSMFG
jgi:hypothetical protein